MVVYTIQAISEVDSNNLMLSLDDKKKVLVWDAVSEVWELAGYLDSIQYYPAALEVKIEELEGYC